MLNPIHPSQNVATSNVIDITEMSDAALDAYLDAKAGNDVNGADVAHLTITEKYWVARALGIDTSTAAFQYWLG